MRASWSEASHRLEDPAQLQQMEMWPDIHFGHSPDIVLDQGLVGFGSNSGLSRPPGLSWSDRLEVIAAHQKSHRNRVNKRA